jgi:hypothetical protein
MGTTTTHVHFIDYLNLTTNLLHSDILFELNAADSVLKTCISRVITPIHTSLRGTTHVSNSAENTYKDDLKYFFLGM